jgi:hypothetical protein
MQDQINQGDNILVAPTQQGVARPVFIYLLLFTLFSLAILGLYFWNYTEVLSGLKKENKTYDLTNIQNRESKFPMEIVKNDDLFKEINALLNSSDKVSALEKINDLIANANFGEDESLKETAILYRNSIQLSVDREAAIKAYYDFFSNEKYANKNRAYAAMMAAQNTIANADTQKLLIFLSEQEVRNLKEVNSEEILYKLDQKIFNLFPFPLSSSRLATYEIKRASTVQDKKIIFNKYLFRLDDRIQEMLQNPGYNHIVANSLGSIGELHSYLENYKIVNATTTTKIFQDAYNYSLLYSPKLTQDFVLISFLEHEVKINNQSNVEKILKIVEKDGLGAPVIKRLNNSESIKKYYPNILKEMQSNKVFNDRLDVALKK